MTVNNKKYHITQTIKLSIPLIISQVLVMLIGVVDTKMSGALGALALAAVSIGGALWGVTVMVVMGILMALPPLVSEYDGANRQDKISDLAKQSMWLGIVLGVIFFVVVRNLTPLFHIFGSQQDVIPIATDYLHALSWGVLFFPMFLVFRYIADGMSKTQMTLYISLLGLVLNIPLNYVLMFGKFGFPALGAKGCGYASSIVIFIQTIAFGLIIAKHKFFKGLQVFEGLQKPSWTSIRKILVIGLPIGIALFSEGGFFSLVTMLASRLETDVIAAHQIALNFSSLLFMVPLGLSMAITIRVGNALGRKSQADARRAGMIGFTVVFVIQAFLALMILIFPREIVTFYIKDEAVILLAVQLLFLAAIFQISDGIQVASAGALRGIKDTQFLIYSTSVSFWVFGVAASYWFCFVKGWGAFGLWTGMISGLTVAAILNFYRFHKQTFPK